MGVPTAGRLHYGRAMSDLPSMLVPLSGTFPGWPTAEAPSVVQALLVIVGIPVAIGVVITLLVWARKLARRGRAQSTEVSEPLWVGQTGSSAEVSGGERAAVTAGGWQVRDDADETPETGGGASVRW